MKESDFLKNFAKVLGADDAFKELEEKKQKEKMMLERLGARFGVVVQEEVEREVPAVFVEQPVVEPEPIVEQVQVVEEVAEVTPQPIVENVIPPLPQLPVDTIVTKSVEIISKAIDTQAAVDKIDDPIRRELDAIKKTITDLHRYARNTSQMGGGGAGSVDQLDHKTIAVVTDSYNVGRHDYYIGVDYPGNVAIYLPTTVNNGRVLVVKDESGSAAFYPITVVGRVDNDPDGFILKVNNGAVQLIYRNGWRII